jgi:hypothetical protein
MLMIIESGVVLALRLKFLRILRIREGEGVFFLFDLTEVRFCSIRELRSLKSVALSKVVVLSL